MKNHKTLPQKLSNKMVFWLFGLYLFTIATAVAQTQLTLDQCIQIALENNISHQNIRLETETARQHKKAVFTKYFPSVTVSLMGFRANTHLVEIKLPGGNLPVYDGNPANLGNATQFAYFPTMAFGMFQKGILGNVNLIQPIYAGGRIDAGNRLASLEEAVYRYKMQLNENDLRLQTEIQYWRIVSLYEKQNTLLAYEQWLDTLYRQTNDAYRTGLILKNDLLKIKVKQNEIDIKKSKLDNAFVLSLMEFCRHLGIAYDPRIQLTDSISIPDSPAALHTHHPEALKIRPEYLLLLKSVEAEHYITQLKRGEFLPELGLGVSRVYLKFDEKQSDYKTIFFGTLQIPISGWWEGVYTLKARSLKEKIALNHMKESSDLLILQMDKAWLDLSDAYKEIALCRTSREQAEENLKISQDSYQNGLVTISDLLEAQATLIHACDQESEAKAEYRIKRAIYLQVTAR